MLARHGGVPSQVPIYDDSDDEDRDVSLSELLRLRRQGSDGGEEGAMLALASPLRTQKPSAASRAQPNPGECWKGSILALFSLCRKRTHHVYPPDQRRGCRHLRRVVTERTRESGC